MLAAGILYVCRLVASLEIMDVSERSLVYCHTYLYLFYFSCAELWGIRLLSRLLYKSKLLHQSCSCLELDEKLKPFLRLSVLY